MGRIVSNITAFLLRNTLVYLSLLGVLLTFFYFGFSKLKLNEDIYAIFPKGEKFEAFNKVLKENKLNRQVLFSIATGEYESDELANHLLKISEKIKSETKDLLTDFEVLREEQGDVLFEYVFENYPVLADSSDYQSILGKISSDSVRVQLEKINSQLSTVGSIFIRNSISRDPFGLCLNKLQDLNPRKDSEVKTVDNGVVYTNDGKSAIFTANLDFELSNNEKNEELNLMLEDLAKEIGFEYFGPFEISYANSKQVKGDTFITLSVSLGLILLLLILYYRSLLIPVYFVFPALFAGFAGLGMVGYIQPDISAISVATSAVLLGIVLDYSFHFYTHYKNSGSLIETVKELSYPMLLGSFTTIAAFAALLFTNSVLLRNFGLIALVTLASASIFTLVLLPPLIKLTRFKLTVKEKSVSSRIPPWLVRVSLVSVIVITTISLVNISGVSFDGDMNNLSYHPEVLVEKEQKFTGINPLKDKKLNLFVYGENKEAIDSANFVLYEKLKELDYELGLDEIVSTAPFALPKHIIEQRRNNWKSFWSNYGDSTIQRLNQEATKFDFKEAAFSQFESWMLEYNLTEYKPVVYELGLESLIDHEETGSALTSVVLDRSKVEVFKNNIGQLEGVFVFDLADLTNELIFTVQEDFNYLLLFSSLLVFVSLLIVYGRIELALFAFFPMALSWVWILGLASIFSIEFNFVNIIVATFIFGLGDDFSIFVVDGLQQAYKTGSKALGSYRSAIFLSGLTTIIGTGALYFAKHPAINSIAIISVVGISTIMFITLVVQPSIYHFFITRRTQQKRAPITLLGLISSIGLYTYFAVGCVVLNVILLILLLVPIKRIRKRILLNWLMSKLAWSTIYLGFHVKKGIIHAEKLDFSKPSIIIANHSSFLDILLMIMLNPKMVIMVKKWVYFSPFFGAFIRYCGYLYIAEGAEYNLDHIKNRIEEGYSVMIFPEGTRSRTGEMQRFHKGAFHLASELKVDIQPILIVGAHYVNPKNDIIIRSGVLGLWVMDRFSHSDPLFNQRLGLVSKGVRDRMEIEMKEAKDYFNTVKVVGYRIVNNYLFKGPMLEWYVRVKWGMEKDNFKDYDHLLKDKSRIYDVGCGYGYLSYYLHYRDSERVISSYDYDEDKIAVAAHCYDKSENLSFYSADMRELQYENPDAILFNDVLHYLPREEQDQVLLNASKALNSGGVILIRDGITDLDERHTATQRSERFSTKFFKFNKTSGPLSFFSSKDIFSFAEKNEFSCEIVDQSKKMSNVLFILRKS